MSSEKPTARGLAEMVAKIILDIEPDPLQDPVRQCSAAILPHLLAAERAARAEGFREGKKRMRRRSAELSRYPYSDRVGAQHGQEAREVAACIDAAILSLPLEVDDATL